METPIGGPQAGRSLPSTSKAAFVGEPAQSWTVGALTRVACPRVNPDLANAGARFPHVPPAPLLQRHRLHQRSR